MKKIMIFIGLVFVLSGCSKDKSYDKNELIQSMKDYTVSESELSEYYEVLENSYYDNNKLHVLGASQGCKGIVNEISVENKEIINSCSVSKDYVYGPYNYVNGEFYARGCKYTDSAESPDKQLETLGRIRYTCSYDDKIYGLSVTDNQKNFIFERDTDNDDVIIKNMDSVLNYDYTKMFFSAVTADKSYIYIASFEIASSAGAKRYKPYLYILDKEYELKKVITDIDVDMPEFLTVNDDGSVIIGKYISESDETIATVVNVEAGKSEYSVKLDGDCTLYSGKDKNHMYLFDGISKVFRFNTENSAQELLYDISEADQLDTGEVYHMIECNDLRFSYIKTFDGYIDLTFAIDDNGTITEEDNRKNFYYPMFSDYGMDYISNYNGERVINIENRFDVNSDVFYAGDKICIFDTDELYITDDGDLKSIGMNGREVCNVFKSKERMFIVYNEKNKYYIAEIKDNKIIDPLNINELFFDGITSEVQFVCGDELNDIYAIYKGLLYGINYDNKSGNAILDLSVDSVNVDAVIGSQLGFVIVDGNKLYIFKEKKEDTSEKRIITIAVSESDVSNKSFRPFIEDFKKLYDDIEIRTEAYSIVEDENGNYISLEKDYINNTLPDIVLISDCNSEFFNLERSGAFCDLNDFIKGDSDFDENDYLTNVLDAFSVNKCLYAFPVNFKLNTIITRYDIDQNITYGWDYNEFINYIASNSDTPVFGNMKKDSLSNALNLSNNPDFIDLNENKVNFDSQEFIDLIENINEYGVDIADNNISDFYSGERYLFETFSNVNRSVYMYRTAYELLHSIKGYPSGTNNYSYVESGCTVSISASSKNKDVCWEFLKFITAYQDDAYYGKDGNNFSVNRERFENELEMIEVKTDNEFVDTLRSLIEGVHFSSRNNERISNIIYEELMLYYNGDITAEDTAKVIQNKINLYLCETK